MKKTTLMVILFAVAFGFVEASVVIYLRHILKIGSPNIGKEDVWLLLPGIAFLEPQAAIRVIQNPSILDIERIREAATLIMLLTTAEISGDTLKKKAAYFSLAFGTWDIFYYAFLHFVIGWPSSLDNLDVFFLLPTPWVGPVFVPLAISIAMITGSVLYLRKNNKKDYQQTQER
jgi:hypothetical protein